LPVLHPLRTQQVVSNALFLPLALCWSKCLFAFCSRSFGLSATCFYVPRADVQCWCAVLTLLFFDPQTGTNTPAFSPCRLDSSPFFSHLFFQFPIKPSHLFPPLWRVAFGWMLSLAFWPFCVCCLVSCSPAPQNTSASSEFPTSPRCPPFFLRCFLFSLFRFK